MISDLESKARCLAFDLFNFILDDTQKPYFIHLCQVVRILREVTDDPEILAAGWLHDLLEDTDYSRENLLSEFGQRVHDLVMEVTHEKKPNDENYGFYFPRLKTRDGMLIKFADRLSNLTRIDGWGKDRYDQYLRRSKFWKDGT